MFSQKSASNPLNSLSIKCIRDYCKSYERREPEEWDEKQVKNLLNINLRQSIIDYIVRERITVCSKLIIHLIDGQLFGFDLWQLSESNNFKVNQIIDILDALSRNCNSLNELVLGGSDWIYNSKVIGGPLKRLFQNQMPKLVSLKMQQIANEEDLLSVFKSCNRLRKLEICQPSITDRDINNIEQRLTNCQVVQHLKELLLPSSLKCNSLLKLLAIFTKIQTLKCAPFEQLLELIDSFKSSPNKNDAEMAERAAITLSSLRSLTITHPMSYDTIDRIVEMCPKLRNLSLEIQDGMQLSSIVKLSDLKHLELRNSPTLPASYAQQVLPILQTSGKQLELLSLEHFDVIDLTTCAKLCPNLLTFSAQWFTILSYNSGHLSSIKRDKVKNPFSNLKHLRLRPRSQRNIPSDACAFCLTHAKQLSHIELYCCYDLSDNDVQVLQSKNPLTHLRSLILRHGHNVTKEALNLLVSRSNELSFIDCGTPPLKKGDQQNHDLAPDP
jgi:hypothetical protein